MLDTVADALDLATGAGLNASKCCTARYRIYTQPHLDRKLYAMRYVVVSRLAARGALGVPVQESTVVGNNFNAA